MRRFVAKVENDRHRQHRLPAPDLALAVLNGLHQLIETTPRTGRVLANTTSETAKFELDRPHGEIRGLQTALDRHRRNVIQHGRNLRETRVSMPTDISGFWIARKDRPISMEIMQYSGAISSFFQASGCDHWLSGNWSPSFDDSPAKVEPSSPIGEFQVQIWRRDRERNDAGVKETTVMFGRIYEITDGSFSYETFSSIGNLPELPTEFAEHIIFLKAS